MIRCNNPRRGMGMILAVVLLAMVAAAIGGLVREIATRRAVLDLTERQAQAARLADAGLRRARARLDRDPAYIGETWALPAQTLGHREDAEVVITVIAGDEAVGTREVVAVAFDPVGERETRVKVTRRARITTGPRPEGESRP